MMVRNLFSHEMWMGLALGLLLIPTGIQAQDMDESPQPLGGAVDEQALVCSDNPELLDESDDSGIFDVSEYSGSSDTSENSEASENSEISENLDSSEKSESSETSESSENSDLSDFSESSEPTFTMPLMSLNEKFNISQHALGNDKPYYKFLDDISWVGVPLFVAGIIAKSEKRAFRQDYNDAHGNTRLVLDFKTEVDNYTQYLPPLLAVGLKLGGVEGRSDWPRFLVSSAISYGAMALLVNSIKYTAKEMRPDGSTANSWPSGHTATAFVGATILHKEYGLTESPWYSVLGYATATATGIMRVLNNRHWVSDVLSGAGIGIMSGELGYALADLIFKGKGLRKGDLGIRPSMNRDHPSFFDVFMGIGLGANNLNFDLTEFGMEDEITGEKEDISFNLKFATATVVGVEGAYFFNKYVGIGGRFKVTSSPIKGWDKVADYMTKDLDEAIGELKDEPEMNDFITSREFNIISDHLTEFTADAGVYFNFPLSDRFAIGAKALMGRSIMQELDMDLTISGNKKNFFYDLEILQNEVVDFSANVTDAGEQFTTQWDFLTVGADNSTKFGTGISLTYSYKNNFCWKVFCDYDYSKKTYTMKLDPYEFVKQGIPGMVDVLAMMGENVDPIEKRIEKKMNRFVLGASFSVAF